MGGFPIEVLRPALTTPLHMPSRCRVLTITVEYDEYGGEKPKETVDADTRCRLEPGGGSEDVFQSAVRNRTSGVVHLPFGTPVSTENVLDIDGRRFNVEAIAARSPGHSTSVEIAVSDVD